MSGFEYDDGEGTTLAAIKSSDGIFHISAEFDERDFNAMVCVEMPKEKAVEFARWILSQFDAAANGENK